MRPMFGMNPVLLDDKANELTGNDQSGALCLKTPWPGMARTVVGDHERLSSSHVFTNFLSTNLKNFYLLKYYIFGLIFIKCSKLSKNAFFDQKDFVYFFY
jgi:hypothetical protein